MISRLLALPSLIVIIVLAKVFLELTAVQVYALTVFLGFIFGTLLFWRFRLAFAFTGVTALLALGVLDIPTIIEFAGLEIILFLMGTMLIIGFLEERRFFEYVLERIVTLVGPRGYRLTAVMMLMSALFAALVGEVTSILFMAATMIHLAVRLRVNPIPFVIMMIFATNVGSSATVVGNPVGVMIAMRAGLTFADFLRWATPISILALALVIPSTMLYFRRELYLLDERLKLEVRGGLWEGREAIPSKDLLVSTLVFLGMLIPLIFHASIEELLGLSRNSMLVGTVIGVSAVVLFIERERARELVEMRVDWWTLAFFLLLFSSVGALSFVGVTERIAQAVLSASFWGELGTFITFVWSAGVMSAFMDNVLAVATLIPVVHDMGRLGVQTFPYWWGALFAGTFLGNLTLIGSTANIVAVSMLERRRLGVITMGEWIKPGAIASLLPLALATFLIAVQVQLTPG